MANAKGNPSFTPMSPSQLAQSPKMGAISRRMSGMGGLKQNLNVAGPKLSASNKGIGGKSMPKAPSFPGLGKGGFNPGPSSNVNPFSQF